MNLSMTKNRMSVVTMAAVMVVSLSAVLFLGCSTTETPTLKVGLAETVITPPMNDVPMRGYAARNSTGVHDDLFARSIAIEDGDGTSSVLMTVAVCNMAVRFMERIREGISGATSVPVENIIVSCTHTHSGPHVSRAGEEFQDFFVERCVESGVNAWNSREPGRIGAGATVCRGLGMNDRRMLHGGMHPDPEVGVLKIENPDGSLKGVAFIYGCHPSTLDLHNLEFTEDWPYYSITGIKERIGEDVWVAYFQSAQGDAKVGYTAELSAVGAYMYGLRTYEFAEYKGRMMVDPVVTVLDSIETSGDADVAVAHHTMDLPRRETYPVTHEEALRLQKEAREKLEKMEANAEHIGKRQLDFQRVEVFLANQMVGRSRWVEENIGAGPVEDVWQQAVRIGDTVLVTFPNEVFTEIGKTVKDNSPHEKTFVIGLTSGHGGYLPTKEEYLEGGYAANGTGFSPECEEVLVDRSRAIIGMVAER